jgi:carboxymethylenebutenolidase
MTAQWIEIKTAEGVFGAYLALPPQGRDSGPQGGKGPGIVLIQEIFGVNEHIRAVADQYALDGYVVLAPDLFWRNGHRMELGYAGDDFQKGIDLMMGLDFAKVATDLAATAQALRARPEVTGKIASLGYCLGGRLSYVMAAQGAVEAAVCYYGSGIDTMLDQVPQITCPIQFHFAALDHYIPLPVVEAVKGAFAGRAQAAVHLYPGVDHGFNCWGRAMYDQRAAALARGRVLQFLAEAL